MSLQEKVFLDEKTCTLRPFAMMSWLSFCLALSALRVFSKLVVIPLLLDLECCVVSLQKKLGFLFFLGHRMLAVIQDI